MAAANKLRSENLDAQVQIDLNDEKTHDAAARYIEVKFGKLDILINNAAILEDYGARGVAAPMLASRTTSATTRLEFW